MLERISRVVGVGRFESFEAASDMSFAPVTLIYGDNGTGKTTLAAVLDSLREASPSIISRRAAFSGTSPEAAVEHDGVSYEFDGHAWVPDLPHDTLEVYYSEFVSRNVHCGNGVANENQRGLCEFALGRQAVLDIAALNQADSEARAAQTGIRDSEQRLRPMIRSGISVEAFTALAKNDKVDVQISECQAAIARAADIATVSARKRPQKVNLPLIQTDAVQELLGRSIDAAAEAAAAVRTHVGSRLDARGEKWLQDGLSYHGTDGPCPFCGQDTATSELVRWMSVYFSDAYSTYAREVSSGISTLSSQLSSDCVLRLKLAIETEKGVAALWSDLRTCDGELVDAAVEVAAEKWSAAAELVRQLLEKKSEDITGDVDAGGMDEVAELLLEAEAWLWNVTAEFESIATSADAHVASLEAFDATAAQKKLNSLLDQKARYEQAASTLVAEYQQFKADKDAAVKRKDALKKSIDSHATSVVGKYQKAINEYLAVFGSLLEIEQVRAGYPGGRASVDYVLRVNGHAIPLGYLENAPCFHTVLSEGDKSILGLALFMARLKDRTDLSGVTVVFDDPVNSLGRTRRQHIVTAIRELHKRGAQVVVLTHEETLAAQVWNDKVLGKRCLPLTVQRSGRHHSELASWDIESALQSDYVRNYVTLATFLEDGGDHEAAAKAIRPYVEQRIRYVFPGGPFTSNDSLGVMIGRIRSAPDGGVLDGLKSAMSMLETLNDAALPEHHGMEDSPRFEGLDAATIEILAQTALDVV